MEVHKHWGYVLVILEWLAARVAVHLKQVCRPGLAMIAGVLTTTVLFITGYSDGELVYRERGRGGDAGYAAPAPQAVHRGAIVAR